MKLYRKLSLRHVFLLAASSAALVAQSASKRPITHRDYDGWKTILGQKLSNDGKWLAYTLTPQEGDGELVLRNLATGAERRESIGSRPPLERNGETEPAAEPVEPVPGGPARQGPRSIPFSFTSDNKYLILYTLPSKAAADQVRKEKKAAPNGGLVILPTAGGDAFRIADVRSFQIAENNAQWLAYSKGLPPAQARAVDGESKKSRPSGSTAGGAGREFCSDLVLRKLNNGAERTFPDVSEYSLAKDGATILYAVSSKKEETNGVYAAATDGSESKALLNGKGRYSKITWDDKQTQAAFLSTHDDASARQPKYKLYYWKRGGSTAESVVSDASTGFRTGWVVSERGATSFSKDGERIFFGTAPARAERRPADDATEEKVTADLWHWKDDNVQPMQKVRAEADRNRTYRGVFHIAQKRVVQLADPTMPELTLNPDNTMGIGSDDREYRSMVEFDERHSDYYLVDVATGARTLVARNHRGSLNTSPDGKRAVTFNGRDWIGIELATGRRRNLTEAIGVAFYNEEYDSPGTRPPYGGAGWSKDNKHVFVYDRFDIWQLSPDGAVARNLTDGLGRKEKLQFRNVRFGEEPAPAGGRGGGGGAGGGPIDTTKPLTLRAENIETRDTGFWEQSVDATGPPRKLIMAAKAFGNPIKAKNADVVLLTATRFDEFGDLLVTDSKFTNLKKVSNANPQKDQVLWGSAELIPFRNLDGMPLKAALYKPGNFDPNKKYPMLIYIYERLSQGVHGFKPPAPGTSINITYYTSNGYLVLTPDIAYTIGYPGQSALKCVIPAIQAVVDKGWVDENAIGIQGHSWGGYQIAYMLTQTTRFKAAAAGAPVANMTSAYDGIRWGTGLPRQFQYERTQSRIGGSLWQYPMRFLENSPIFQADRVKTPVLMLHNDADDAVPWYQGIEYFLALRRLGKEVYLFNYNGEPHGLRKRPNQKDYTMRMQQFFDHHLKGAPKPEWMERGIPYLEREQEKDKWKKTGEALPTGGGQ